MFLQENTGLRIFLYGSLRVKGKTAGDIDLIAISDDWQGNSSLEAFQEAAYEAGKRLDVTLLSPDAEYFNPETGLTDLDRYWDVGDTWSIIKAVFFPDREEWDEGFYSEGWHFFGGTIHPHKMDKPDFSAEITPAEVTTLAGQEPSGEVPKVWKSPWGHIRDEI
jgi:hypothetical protein